jgi:CRP-like cAMP-binding protein
MERLLSRLDKISLLETELKKYLKDVIKTSYPKKGDDLVRPDDIANRIYFIEKGLIRGYRVEEDIERTYYFMTEGDVFISVRSFLTQTPATEYIECKEDCILHSISFKELRYAYAEYPSFNFHRAELLQYYYLLSIEREEMRQLPAYGRYCFLMKNQPQLIGRVQDKYLASYLNIAKSTFSRKKGEYQKKLKENSRSKRC